MEQKEIDELKEKYKVKSEAKPIYLETPLDSQKALEIIVDALYECYQKGENVYVEKYVNIPTGYFKYKIYSCDFEGTTKEQFLSNVQNRDRTMNKNSRNIEVVNGSYQLPKKMLKDFEKGSDKIYVYNGYNGISAVFDHYDLDVRTDEDFLDFVTITTEGESIEEKRQREEAAERKRQSDRLELIEKIKNQMPKWIEDGNAFIYLEKQEEWKEYVESYQGDSTLYARIIEQALEVMRCLEEKGSLIEAQQVIEEQGHSGWSHREINDIIFRFSKKGPDFYEDTMRYVLKQDIDAKTAKKISEQRRKNNEYAHAEMIRIEKLSKRISVQEIGQATINAPTVAKMEAQQIEHAENIRDNIKEGVEVDDN